MSTLWTPSGEHPVDREDTGASPGPPPAGGPPGRPGPPGGSRGPSGPGDPGPEDEAAVAELRRQLAETPPEVVVANHCYGLFELAAIYLSQTPPMLFQARLAIDGLGYLLDGLRGRLGEAEPSLHESLSQLRLAFVRLEGAEQSGADNAANTGQASD
ncbi:MAG TPA: hypothetical protein VKG43_12975 [Acidimicrobiales bacterium]|nr:hypothetical protein [Acidimicrobiales bacterium]